MEKFFLNNRKFNIPLDKIDSFLKDNPSAVRGIKYTLSTDNGQRTFTIPETEVDSFLKSYPTAKAHSAEKNNYNKLFESVLRQENSIEPTNPYGINMPLKISNKEKFISKYGAKVRDDSSTLISFKNKKIGKEVGERIIKNIWDSSESNPAKFYSNYSGKAIDSPEVKSFVSIYKGKERDESPNKPFTREEFPIITESTVPETTSLAKQLLSEENVKTPIKKEDTSSEPTYSEKMASYGVDVGKMYPSADAESPTALSTKPIKNKAKERYQRKEIEFETLREFGHSPSFREWSHNKLRMIFGVEADDDLTLGNFTAGLLNGVAQLPFIPAEIAEVYKDLTKEKGVATGTLQTITDMLFMFPANELKMLTFAFSPLATNEQRREGLEHIYNDPLMPIFGSLMVAKIPKMPKKAVIKVKENIKYLKDIVEIEKSIRSGKNVSLSQKDARVLARLRSDPQLMKQVELFDNQLKTGYEIFKDKGVQPKTKIKEGEPVLLDSKPLPPKVVLETKPKPSPLDLRKQKITNEQRNRLTKFFDEKKKISDEIRLLDDRIKNTKKTSENSKVLDDLQNQIDIKVKKYNSMDKNIPIIEEIPMKVQKFLSELEIVEVPKLKSKIKTLEQIKKEVPTEKRLSNWLEERNQLQYRNPKDIRNIRLVPDNPNVLTSKTKFVKDKNLPENFKTNSKVKNYNKLINTQINLQKQLQKGIDIDGKPLTERGKIGLKNSIESINQLINKSSDIIKKDTGVELYSFIGIPTPKMLKDVIKPFKKLFKPNEVKPLKQTEVKQILTSLDIAKQRAKSISKEIEKVKDESVTGKPLSGDELKRRYKEEGIDIKAVEEVTSMYEATKKEFKDMKKLTYKKVRDILTRNIVDASGNAKRVLEKEGGDLGKKAVMHHNLIKGAPSKSLLEYENASKKIYKNLSKSETEEMNKLISSRRTIAIDSYKKDVTSTANIKGDKHSEYVRSVRVRLNNDEAFSRINNGANQYFKEMLNQLTQLYDNGLINEGLFNSLKTKEYSPRKFIQHIDPELNYTFNNKMVSTTKSGIKPLEKGSDRAMELDSSLLLSEVIYRTQSRIFKNNADKALYEIAKEIPDNGFVKLPKSKIQNKLSGYETIEVMIDGNPKKMFVDKKISGEWIGLDPVMSPLVANILGWASGARILKPFATGINMEFALANFPRDIAYIYLRGNEFSKHLPKYGLQMLRNIGIVGKDAITRKGRFTDYIKEGGGMNFLTHQGMGGKKSPFGKIGEYLGYLGETSEIITRLAVREQAIMNGKSPKEATSIARGIIDFSQGGRAVKALDNVVPYLNASVQGTRGILKSAKKDPKDFTVKIAQIGATSSGLWLANNLLNKEAYDAIPNYVKRDNWVITTPDLLSYKDDTGKKRYRYIAIPKDHGQKVFASIFDASLNRYFYGEFPTDDVIQGAKEYIPISLNSLITPVGSAVLSYASNYDYWRDDKIWKGREDISPTEEYYKSANPALVSFAKSFNLSPTRLKRSVEKLTTSNNIYADLVGATVNQITKNFTEKQNEQLREKTLKDIPFLRRIAKVTPRYEKDKITDKLILESNTKRFVQNREIDILAEKAFKEIENTVDEKLKNKILRDELLKINKTLKDGDKKHFTGLSSKDRKRLYNRFQNYIKIRDIPDRPFYLNILHEPPEIRALAYFHKWIEADKKGRAQMDKDIKKIKGFKSPLFIKNLNKIKRNYKVP